MFIMSILFQVLKLYAWELLFKEKILSIRKTEMKILWKASIIGIGFTFSWTVAPYIVSHYIYICVWWILRHPMKYMKIAELDCCQIIILSIYMYHLHMLRHMSYVYL